MTIQLSNTIYTNEFNNFNTTITYTNTKRNLHPKKSKNPDSTALTSAENQSSQKSYKTSYKNNKKVALKAQNINLPKNKPSDLTPEEHQFLKQLKTRDREVKAHEQAHKSVAGKYVVGEASYRYQKGPDGNRYAIAGEVKIDTSTISGDPEATIQKADTVRRAATAPANPSPQDIRVAGQASIMELEAKQELVKKEAVIQNERFQSNIENNSPLYEKNIVSGSSTAVNYATSGEKGKNKSTMLDILF